MSRLLVLVLASWTWFVVSSPEVRSDENGCRFLDGPVLKPVWDDPVLGKSGEHDPGDYEMQLQSDFTYIDCSLHKHTVKAGTVVNGASVPRGAWTILGYTPWTGPVQKPSIIHDDLCGRALFTSDKVHALFHEALLKSGVSSISAAMMYAAVLNFGPQWSTPGGAVSHPTYVEGTMMLIARLLGRNERIDSRIVRVARERSMLGPESLEAPNIYKLQIVSRHQVVRSRKRALTGQDSLDADAVLSVLKEVQEIPSDLHERLATNGVAVR